MKKKTIGIPKALLYYRYKILWKYYFEYLGYNIIYSKPTTKEILEIGKKLSVDESCISSKIFLGHVYDLINKCDYILIPRVCNYGKEEKVCVKFNAIYDIINNLFPSINIIDYNIENTKKLPESLSLIKLGIKLTKKPFKTIISYYKSKIKEKNYLLIKNKKQEEISQSNKSKLLIISHPYTVYDNYIGLPIISLLKKYNFDLLYSDRLDRKTSRKYAKKLSPSLYWTYSKEAIGSISYYKEKIDGIIFLTSFPCGPDSLVNELMIRKIINIPTLNILIDEFNSFAGIETRIESFIDIIKKKRDKNE